MDLAFGHTGCYKYLNKLRNLWDEARHDRSQPSTWCKEIGPMMASQKISAIELAFCWFQVKENRTFDIRSKPNKNFMTIQHELIRNSTYPINIVTVYELIRSLELE